MPDVINVAMTREQWADIESLLERGLDDLSHYLKGHAQADGIAGDELADMERLSDGVAAHNLSEQLAASSSSDGNGLATD